MQCTNCQFQNMPGSEICGRCGTSLMLSTATLDVHPPRAGAVTKRFRNAVPVTRAYHGAVRAMADLGAVRQVMPTIAGLPQILRSIVPGWAHFHADLRWLGHAFLWGFLVFFIPGMLHFGSSTGSILLGLAFSVHSTAVLDIVMRSYNYVSFTERMSCSVAVTILLALLIYYPAGRFITRIMEPHTIESSFGPFRRGDVVFVSHWTKIKPGKMVLYTPVEVQADITSHQRRERNYTVFRGTRIDRVLAGPGDEIVWEAGRLTVNGRASAWRPLDASRAPARLAFNVPPRHLFILPTGGVSVPLVEDLDSWEKLSLVPMENVVGHAYTLP